MNKKIRQSVISEIKAKYTEIDWERFEDIDRALNFELWYGTGDEYWGHAEDLEHYEWKGFIQAQDDLEDILAPLPHELWFDADCDLLFDQGYDPDDDEYNWMTQTDPETGDYIDFIWIGSDGFQKVNLREYLMFEETYRQVF